MDLSHWNSRKAFTIYEAARLIAGIDPNLCNPDMSAEIKARITGLERELNDAHQRAMTRCLDKNYTAMRPPAFVPDELPSNELLAAIDDAFVFAGSVRQWFEHFDATTFSRAVLARWVAAHNINSSYNFVVSHPEESRAPNKKAHNTLLRLVIVMAVMGYKYDPAAKRNAAAQEIADDAEQMGLPIDPDTVRSYLKQAAELLPRTR